MRTVLEILSDGNYVSGESISKELGITRAAVWKKIELLRREGWQIVSGGKRGYQLISGDGLAPELWVRNLQTKQLGHGKINYSYQMDSTNTQAKLMAIQGEAAGSLCICETQTNGHGRLGRSWISKPGAGLWQSVLLRPLLPPNFAPLITLCVAVAMADAIQESVGLKVGIKWPNDLVYQGRKLCGILLECAAEIDRIDWVVVGVGLNVFPEAIPEDLKSQACCISEYVTPPPRRSILTTYLKHLEKWMYQLENHGFTGIASEYRSLCLTLDHPVRVSGLMNFTGVAEDIDETGALLVRDSQSSELKRVLAGDVSVRGVMGYV